MTLANVARIMQDIREVSYRI